MNETISLRELVTDAAQKSIIGTTKDCDVDNGNYEGQVTTCIIDDVRELSLSDEIDPLMYTVKGVASCDCEYLDYDGKTHTNNHNFEIEVTVTFTPCTYDSTRQTITSIVSTDVLTAYAID